MTLSELIEELGRLEKENGDSPVRFVVKEGSDGVHYPLIDAQLIEGFVLLFGAPVTATMDWPREQEQQPPLK